MTIWSWLMIYFQKRLLLIVIEAILVTSQLFWVLSTLLLLYVSKLSYFHVRFPTRIGYREEVCTVEDYCSLLPVDELLVLLHGAIGQGFEVKGVLVEDLGRSCDGLGIFSLDWKATLEDGWRFLKDSLD